MSKYCKDCEDEHYSVLVQYRIDRIVGRVVHMPDLSVVPDGIGVAPKRELPSPPAETRKAQGLRGTERTTTV